MGRALRPSGRLTRAEDIDVDETDIEDSLDAARVRTYASGRPAFEAGVRRL